MTKLCGPQGCQSLLRQGTGLHFLPAQTQHYLILQEHPSEGGLKEKWRALCGILIVIWSFYGCNT